MRRRLTLLEAAILAAQLEEAGSSLGVEFLDEAIQSDDANEQDTLGNALPESVH